MSRTPRLIVYRDTGEDRTSEVIAMDQRAAAAELGVGLTFFREHVLPHLKVARVGRRVLIPRAELQRWLDREAQRS